MKALVYGAPGDAEVTEIASPKIGNTECLIKPIQVGICHSDFDLLDGNYILPVHYPIIPGHEWFGEVIEVGSDVEGFKAGDRVVGECSVADDQHFGFTIDGAMSTEMKVESAWLHKVPDSIDDTKAALIEPFTVAYGATDKIDASDDVVVFGAGPIGLCAVVSANGKGARVIMIEPDANRRKIAQELGASETIDPINEDVVTRVHELTNGVGASRVIEASGRPAVMAQTLQIAKYSGYITNVGINVGDTAPALLGLIVEKNLTIRGQVGSVGVWPQAIKFLGRQNVDLSTIVSKIFPLDQAKEALAASEKRDVNIKIHVRPQD
jgi:threonine dehydrogenase-like Zn-dependent dehydrogenase